MQVPLLDLTAQYRSIKQEIDTVVNRVIEDQRFILGKELVDFEENIAKYIGVKHAIGVSSGTDALLVALMAVGIGPGDRVVTSPFSFFATAGSIARLGATPVFVDIDPETFNIDTQQLEAVLMKDEITAVIPVHLYGQSCRMDELVDLKKRFNFIMIEDCAQAIGTMSSNGKRAGTFGEFGCFSFFPSKNLGCFGDGGLVTTNDSGMAEHIRALRNHGSKVRYYHDEVGGNFRLDNLQAAVLNVKLKHLDKWNSQRRGHAELYTKLISDRGLGCALSVPKPVYAGNGITDYHTYHQFVIRAERRDALRKHLNEAGIGCEVYYPCPFHMQKCFEGLGYIKGDFPVSEKAAEEVIALPVYPELQEDRIAFVVEQIASFYKA